MPVVFVSLIEGHWRTEILLLFVFMCYCMAPRRMVTFTLVHTWIIG